jgi:hypothetical protein
MTLFGWFRKSAHPPAALVPHPASVEPAPVVPDAATGLPAPTPSVESVRQRLFDAIATGDEERLTTLCREHRDLILAGGAAWLEVPESFRSSAEAYGWYQQGLRAIAEFCSEKLSPNEVTLSPSDTPASPSARQH